MPRLFAPAGVTHYSHGGHEFEVGPDGSVEATEAAAAELRYHGFTEAAPPPSDFVLVKRADLLAALEKLGTAASPDAVADILAAALTAAVAVKEKKPTLTLGEKKPAA